jgi:hypothetical protein
MDFTIKPYILKRSRLILSFFHDTAMVPILSGMHIHSYVIGKHLFEDLKLL